MPVDDPRPELVINYSPQLDLRGTFGYSAHNLYFGLDGFERFAEELQRLQQGLTQEAVLKDPGEMVVLRLERKNNTLLATFDIREYRPPSLAKLHVVLEVDYDLFVNKLKRELDRFLAELRECKPAS